MDQQQKEDLLLAVRLTEEMLVHAKKQEWESIQEKENQRKVLFDKIFALEVKERDGQEIGDQIVYILDLNKQITAILVSEKQSMGLEISQLNRAKTATHAYLSHTR